MKFLCVDCDEQMAFEDRRVPGDGTMAAAFRCPSCDRVVAMLTNPMETQLVSSLGVKVGGRTVPEAPFEGIRSGVASGREDAFREAEAPVPEGSAGDPAAQGSGEGPTAEAAPAPPGPVRWSVDAVERLGHVPSFVRGMVKKIYTEYARERGIEEITPAVMDRARSDLGLEGM